MSPAEEAAGAGIRDDAIDEIPSESTPGPTPSPTQAAATAEFVPEPRPAFDDLARTTPAGDGPEPAPPEGSVPEILSLPAAEPSGRSPGHAVRLDPDGDRRTLRALAERLAPVGALEADVLTVDGVRIFAFLAPTLPVETVMPLTAQVLGLLDSDRAPWPIDQLTLRLEDGAIVLTPPPAARVVRTLLVAAIRRGGSLAMLELASKQAAAECLAVSNGHPGTPLAVGDDDGMALHEVAAGPAQRQVAGMLGGLGRLVPTVFRGGADGLELSLFVDAGEDALAVARYAHRACRALRGGGIPPGLGPVRSAVARTGDRRLALMPMDGAPGRWTALLTATGAPARPGLVRLHAERAAARLAAS